MGSIVIEQLKDKEVKILTHSCGCKKGICLLNGKPDSWHSCDRSCAGCTDARYTDPCPEHQSGKGVIGNVIKIAYA